MHQNLVELTLPELHDAFDTPAVNCRLNLESWQNKNIDRWMWSKWPLLEYVWELTEEKTKRRKFVLLFNINTWRTAQGQNMSQRPFNKAHLTHKITWHWQDQFGIAHVSPQDVAISEKRRYQKENQFYLYIYPPKHSSGQDILKPTQVWPAMSNITSDVIFYNTKPFLTCNKIEKSNPPPAHVKVGVCITRFWGQHDLMPEWIMYHRMLGVQHFWLFVAEPFGNIFQTMPRYESDITYIPYNYTWKSHSENAPPDFKLPCGGGELFQETANNQCLYLAKQYGVDWITMPDYDEFFVINDPSITHFSKPAPLQQLLDRENIEAKETICVYGAAYGRHPELEPRDKSFELMIDFTYRKNRTISQVKDLKAVDGHGAGGRKKCFYKASKVWTVKIHGAGFNMFPPVNKEIGEIELAHFRTPMVGVHQTEVSSLVSYPRTKKMYREKVMKALRAANWKLTSSFSIYYPPVHYLLNNPALSYEKTAY